MNCGAGSRSYDRYHKRIGDWKGMASDFLCDLYALQQAADAISRRYLDGRQLLFPAHARNLARLVEVVEELVVGYNEGFANGSVQETGLVPDELAGARTPNPIIAAELQDAVAPVARQHAAFLVDMARAEALDALGENQAAVAILERHV